MAIKTFEGKITSEPKSKEVFSKTERNVKERAVTKEGFPILEMYVEHYANYKDVQTDIYGMKKYYPALESYKVSFVQKEDEGFNVGDSVRVKGDSKEVLSHYNNPRNGQLVSRLIREIENATVDLVKSA